MTVESAICAVMANAAYNAKAGQGQGRYSQDRINNALAEAAKRYPGLAKEIEKYEVVKSDQNMFVAVNHTDKKAIVSYRGTLGAADVAHDLVNVALGYRSTIETSIVAGVCGLPHRFNTALNFALDA
jgi:hypothetical protein